MSRFGGKPPRDGEMGGASSGAIRYCPESGKPCYDKRGAVTAANVRRKRAAVRLRAYPCPSCGAWHLTKKGAT